MAYILDTIAGVHLMQYDEDDTHEYERAGVTSADIALTWGAFRKYLRTTTDMFATVNTADDELVEIWDIQLVTFNGDDIDVDIDVVALGAPAALQMVDRSDPRSVLSEPGTEVLIAPKPPAVLAERLDALFEAAQTNEALRDLGSTAMSIDYLGA